MINGYKTPFYTKSAHKRIYLTVTGCGSIEGHFLPLKGIYVNVVNTCNIMLWSKGTEISQMMGLVLTPYTTSARDQI